MTLESHPVPALAGIDDSNHPIPLEKANFSLFLVPIRYRLERRVRAHESATPGTTRERSPQSGLQFVEDAAFHGTSRPEDRWLYRQRRNYVTAQTRDQLFGAVRGGDHKLATALERSVHWFKLSSPLTLHWPSSSRHDGGAAHTLRLPLTAELVLFDALAAARGRANHAATTVIGFLIVEVSMTRDATLADALRVNELFRLIRYQHFGQYDDLRKSRADVDEPARAIRYPGFAISFPEPTPLTGSTAEDEDEVLVWRHLLRHPVAFSDRSEYSLEVDLDCYPDERCFVASHLCVEGVSWDISPQSWLWMLWHQLMYVESDVCPSAAVLTPTEDAWVRQRTYFRWAERTHKGRLYGFSSYCAGALCKSDAYPFPTEHFRSIYLDQLILVLYQRVCVLGFGRELAALTAAWRKDGWGRTRNKLGELREAFDQFVNLWWFPVFTSQLQGLEMYEIARRELGNLELFEEVRSEMAGTWELMDSKLGEALNRGAFWFATTSVALAFLGVSLLQPVASQIQPDATIPSSQLTIAPFSIATVLLCVAVVCGTAGAAIRLSMPRRAFGLMFGAGVCGVAGVARVLEEWGWLKRLFAAVPHAALAEAVLGSMLAIAGWQSRKRARRGALGLIAVGLGILFAAFVSIASAGP